MTLDAVVFPFGRAIMRSELFSFGEGSSSNWCYDFGHEEEIRELDMAGFPVLPSSMETGNGEVAVDEKAPTSMTATATATDVGGIRKRRRRTRCCKNKEEVENQRMTHIAVERNRRKLMNEHLSVLRSIMPSSYIQRGDQASIVGGAINYVKQLEQLLQSLEAQRNSSSSSSSSFPFSDFFTFPRYSSSSSTYSLRSNVTNIAATTNYNEAMAKNQSAIADIEVTMVERHANIKILTKQQRKQLLGVVIGLQNLRFTTLHLNVTTFSHMVLYSFSVAVEEDCHLTSVDEIATAVHHMVGQIQDELS